MTRITATEENTSSMANLTQRSKLTVSPTSAFDAGVALRRRLPSPSNTIHQLPPDFGERFDVASKREVSDQGCLSPNSLPNSSSHTGKHSFLLRGKLSADFPGPTPEAISREKSDNCIRCNQTESSILSCHPFIESTKVKFQGAPQEGESQLQPTRQKTETNNEWTHEDKHAHEKNENGRFQEDLIEVHTNEMEETEDEEVKNFVGSRNGEDESVGSDEFSCQNAPCAHDLDEDETKSRATRDDELVTFVSGKIAVSAFHADVKRPTPITQKGPNVGETDAAHSDSESHDGSIISSGMSKPSSTTSTASSASSEGGRGLGLALDASHATEIDSHGELDAENDDNTESSGEEGSIEDEDYTEDDDDNHEGEESSVSESSGHESDQESKASTQAPVVAESLFPGTQPVSSSIEMDLQVVLGQRNSSSRTNATPSAEEEEEKSISMEELEEIINESPKDQSSSDSDLEFSDTEEIVVSTKAAEKIVGLVSDELEFEYWSSKKLFAAVSAIIHAVKDSSKMTSAYPIQIPDGNDTSFWVDKMLQDIAPTNPAMQLLIDNPEHRAAAAKVMYKSFNAELTLPDLMQVIISDSDKCHGSSVDPGRTVVQVSGTDERRRLFVGSFSAAESRLALAVLHIKHIILISVSPLDELWAADGVTYSTHILPSCGHGVATPICEAISKAADEVALALSIDDPPEDDCAVLVACSTGDEYSCAACALYLSRTLGIDTDRAQEKINQLRPSCKIESSWFGKIPRTRGDVTVSHKTKRVLSSQTLPDLLRKSKYDESPKRLRFIGTSSSGTQGDDMKLIMPPLPIFNLGGAADANQKPVHSLSMRMYDREYMPTDGEEDNEYERRMGEELDEKCSQQRNDCDPIPLLTPPSSPIVVNSNKGTTTVCEWPSNLTVDSAMTSAIALRPLSPNSLQQQEEEEEKRIKSQVASSGSKGADQTPLTPVTGLTPKLESFRVSFQ